MRINLDKIASCTIHAALDRQVEVVERVEPRSGQVVVVRALREKTVYDKVELVSGRMAKISKGDVLAGVLGRRRALRGFVGDIPEQVRPGDRMHVLNIGGVVGVVVSGSLDLGPPLLCELVGSVARDGVPLTISRPLPSPPEKLPDVPLILVGGTCMNSGKTVAASVLIQQLSQRGYRVNGAKLTGVACQRDLLNMEDHGARRTLSFLDAGLPSTVGVEDVAGVSRMLLAGLADEDTDAVVVELGDGIIGYYGVEKVLADPEIRRHAKAYVLCANDLVGAWGACELMRGWDLDIDVLSGPATDNDVGQGYAARELRLAAANARLEGPKLADLVEKAVW